MFYLLYHCHAFYRIWVTTRMSYKKQELLTLLEHLVSPPVFWWGPCCSSFQFFVLSYYIFVCVFTFWDPCCDVRYDFDMKTMFDWSLPPVDPGIMSYLRYLFLFAHSGIQHTFCCVFVLFVFILCLVYPMLPVYLDCSFLIAPYVFSNVYIEIYAIWRRHKEVKGTRYCEPKRYKISNGTWLSRSTICQLYRRLHLINLTRKSCIP